MLRRRHNNDAVWLNMTSVKSGAVRCDAVVVTCRVDKVLGHRLRREDQQHPPPPLSVAY